MYNSSSDHKDIQRLERVQNLFKTRFFFSNKKTVICGFEIVHQSIRFTDFKWSRSFLYGNYDLVD